VSENDNCHCAGATKVTMYILMYKSDNSGQISGLKVGSRLMWGRTIFWPVDD